MGFPKYCAYDARITKFSRAIVRETSGYSCAVSGKNWEKSWEYFWKLVAYILADEQHFVEQCGGACQFVDFLTSLL